MEILHSDKTMVMISRALNLIDRRLVDHGVRVMLVLEDMLNAAGCQDPEVRKNLLVLALLHDVGAYRTEEINNLVEFETGTIWEHSIYGYLFLREFTPLGEWSKVVLYHHADYNEAQQEPAEILRYAQMLHTADRAVVWHDEMKRSSQELKKHLAQRAGTTFSPDSINLLWDADERFHTMAKLDAPIHLEEIVNRHALSTEEARTYLTMVVHTIDFRSHVTVTHTLRVMEIAAHLANLLGFTPLMRDQVRCGALLHDLGKIGTPIEILEKPGRLTPDEVSIMRRHVVLSGEIIHGCVDESVARIALRHHEKLDGSGYPEGLQGIDLTLPERMMAVADIASALYMSRSYKEAFSKERCFQILWDMGNRGQLDTHVVHTLETHFDRIMQEVDDACAPLQEARNRIQEEYELLIREYGRKAKK